MVISLTSFPARMPGLHLTVKSLLEQTQPADLIVIWLAASQFPNGMEDVPSTVSSLLSDRCIIKWCDDYGSYKKLIPTLQAYPDSIVITVDDDVIYESRLVEKLMRGHEAYPHCVIASRVTKLNRKDNVLFIDTGGHSFWKEPSFLNKLVGCAGVLYPPHCLDGEVMNVEAFTKLAPTSDDVWFWLMAVRAGTKTLRITDGEWLPKQNPINRETESLSRINDGEFGLFFTHLDNVLAAYPEIAAALMGEHSVSEETGGRRGGLYGTVGRLSYSMRRLPVARQLYGAFLDYKNRKLAASRYYMRRVMLLEEELSALRGESNDGS